MSEKPPASWAVVAFLLVPFAIAVRAFVLVHFWRWFAVPLGLPALSAAQMYGVSFLVGACLPASKVDRDAWATRRQALESMIHPFTSAGVWLAYGYPLALWLGVS
jgi:hypothetical protein